jgi:hypothetical protein
MRCQSRGMHRQGGPLRPAIDGPGSWFSHIVYPGPRILLSGHEVCFSKAFGAGPFALSSNSEKWTKVCSIRCPLRC